MNGTMAKRFMLVYQGGIANVFQVKAFNLASYGRDAKRLFQGDFYGAQLFARGAGVAGVVVRTAACNMAGDIAETAWTDDLDSQPFSDKLVDVRIN